MEHRVLPKALALAAFLPVSAFAQPNVDIQLTRAADGTAQILLIPSGDFDQVFSSIVFTLSWDSTKVVQEPVFRQANDVRTFIPVSNSGAAFAVGAMKYRKYVGIGFTPMEHVQASMLEGKSFQLGWLEGGEPGSVHIAAEPWLADRRQNGAFHVSLNGMDRTGKIINTGYGSRLPDEVQVNISPNPFTGGHLQYVVTTPKEGTLTIQVHDGRGRTLSTISTHAPMGRSAGTLPAINDVSAGSYTVHVSINEYTTTTVLTVAGK